MGLTPIILRIANVQLVAQAYNNIIIMVDKMDEDQYKSLPAATQWKLQKYKELLNSASGQHKV